MYFLDILLVFRLDIGRISFNLVEKTLTTRQFALLATSLAFYDIFARACVETQISVDMAMSLFMSNLQVECFELKKTAHCMFECLLLL